jgi:hypothetical protein
MGPQTEDVNAPPREIRVRFSRFEFNRSQSGQCSAEVTLEMDGAFHKGKSAGPSSPLGDLRISAEACLRALCNLSGTNDFELMAVKHIRAFDSNLAIVSITHRQGPTMYPLVGCYLAKDDVCRGAAIAVLNATNRILNISGQRGEE